VVDGHDVDILRLTTAKPGPDDPYSPVNLYVDKTSGRIVKKSLTMRSPTGTLDELETAYSGFRRVGSLTQPFSGVIHRNGNKEFQWTIQSCEINIFVDPKVFEVGQQTGPAPGSQNALLTGSVYSPSGDAIVGATVRLHNPATGWNQTATTDANGIFGFPSVPPGEGYVVSVEKAGFRTATRPRLTVKPNEPNWMVPFELQAAATGALNSFSLQDILSLLEAGVLPRRVAQLVQERGVGFDLTTDVEGRLRAAGATEEVLLAIAKNRK
jgi:hypothetical protein